MYIYVYNMRNKCTAIIRIIILLYVYMDIKY